MFKTVLSLITCVLFTITATSQEAYFMLDPTLTPDGNTIIFSYDGDLWKVSANGGDAHRITGMPGDETRPSVSPDGKWLAFSATQYGNRDVYLMTINGGEIQQLTFHDAADDVDSWSWDSKSVYFTSSRYNRFSGYKVAVSGITPERLFQHYFDNSHNIAEHPKTGELFFNETWESKNFTNRKRYKGDYNPDIKSYNFKTKKYTEYTTYRGKDFWTSIDRNGTIYFVSDELNDEYNLYTLNNGKKTHLTNFKTSIIKPQVSANGNAVVFGKDYQIYLYDVASKSAKKVPVNISLNNTLNRTNDFQVKNNISNFDVSPDKKKMAFVSRGELFVSDIKGKFVKQIGTMPDERVLEVVWLKDNRTLLYNQTDKGYFNLFTISADSKGTEKQLTSDARNNVNITFNSDKSKGIYISGRDELRMIDLTSLKSTLLLKDEFWALYAPQPHFSPNDEYIVYNAIRNFESDVFVYNIASKKVTNLTDTGTSENNPVWSADGKYIYFDANLTQPSYPYGNRDANVYQMALDKFEAPYASKKFDELFKKDPKDDKKSDKKKDKKKDDDEDEDKDSSDKKEDKSKLNITINEKGLMDRLQRISPQFGLQRSAFTYSDNDVDYVLYISNHDEGTPKLWKTTMEPFEKSKTEKVSDDRVSGYQIASVDGSHYILMNGKIHEFNIPKGKLDKIEIDHKFRKTLNNEFQQMFHEAWAGFEENFYDGDFHGEDWEKLNAQYSKYLPYITKRSQLRLLFNDMLGELNTSHFGFSSRGKEEDNPFKTTTLSPGIVFANDMPYTVESIVADSPADVSGKNLRKGDKLVAVNGITIDSKRNRESYFAQPSQDKELQLTFERNGQTIQTEFHPASSRAVRNMMYDGWVDDNQTYVDQKSNGKIAYIHMKNMTGGQLTNFKREMVSEAYKKQALILDLRYNTGGNVHDDILRFLSQKPYLNWKYRDGALSPQPNFAPAAKPIIILINEQSLSDAEMTTAGFKQLGLGKVIGTETYRWIIFTSGKGLVDGSFYRLPSWGCYTLDGKNLEKEGVQPDIYVKETFKDRLEGNQPQLDRAIEEITKQF